jgi:rRNA maturation endonuclease Nob1
MSDECDQGAIHDYLVKCHGCQAYTRQYARSKPSQCPRCGHEDLNTHRGGPLEVLADE